jgi:hypothetical protein
LTSAAANFHPENVNTDSLDLALRHVTETKQLLEKLVISSESFDYPQAKLALEQLRKKSRELAKLKTELELRRNLQPNIRVVDFQGESRKSESK